MNKTELTKLYNCIATDFRLVTRKTNLWKLSYCDKILADIKTLMELNYLEKISLILDKPKGTPFKVKQFLIGKTDRKMNDRPGNNDWEEGDGDKLHVVLSYTSLWHALSVNEKTEFSSKNLLIGWVSSSVDTKFQHLNKTISKNYTSNGFGVDRCEFE